MSDVVLFRNALLVDPVHLTEKRGDLLVINGRIEAIGKVVPPAADISVIEVNGRALAPGLVDMRASFCEPGSEHKENIKSGIEAAAAGGITSVALLPDTSPPVDNVASLELIARRARQQKSVKVYPYAALTEGLKGENLAEMGLLKRAGAVGFSDGIKAVANARVMRRALSYASALNALIIQHPEEPELAKDGDANEGFVSLRLGLSGIPSCAEAMMIQRDLNLVELTGARYHIAHITTRAAIDLVRKAKADKLPVTCETTPHHLALNELEIEGYRSFAKVIPPLRSEDDRQAVLEGLADGTIDVIASDHSPQDQDSKRLPFSQAQAGSVGCETMLAVALKLYHENYLSLSQTVAKMTINPARLLGLDAGSLAIGSPADLMIFDPDEPWKIDKTDLKSLSKNSVFDGRLVMGRTHATFVDGRLVFRR